MQSRRGSVRQGVTDIARSRCKKGFGMLFGKCGCISRFVKRVNMTDLKKKSGINTIQPHSDLSQYLHLAGMWLSHQRILCRGGNEMILGGLLWLKCHTCHFPTVICNHSNIPILYDI